MPREIRIEVQEAVSAWQCQVTVVDSDSQTSHTVIVQRAYRGRLAGANEISVEELVRRSFEFLLQRESKESILRQFDLSVISRYFPEYEQEIRKSIQR